MTKTLLSLPLFSTITSSILEYWWFQDSLISILAYLLIGLIGYLVSFLFHIGMRDQQFKVFPKVSVLFG
jgi:hypothetical protein